MHAERRIHVERTQAIAAHATTIVLIILIHHFIHHRINIINLPFTYALAVAHHRISSNATINGTILLLLVLELLVEDLL